jgi:hypothetical protein
MLDIKSQSQLAEATAEMMRACAFATARAASTSMLQGMSFWSRMLHSSAARPTPAFPATWAAWNRACIPQADAQVDETPPQASAEPPADTAFASYRSSGGHAVAQVIVS